MQKGENEVPWRATVTEVMTLPRFETQCGYPRLILRTCIQLHFLHLVLQVGQSNIMQ